MPVDGFVKSVLGVSIAGAAINGVELDWSVKQ
jgi:hypothetical protein